MVIVSGQGPRCGTSSLMQAMKRAGLPVVADPFLDDDLTPVAGNPDGYFETSLDLLAKGLGKTEYGNVYKVWPTGFGQVDWKYVDTVYYLYRTDTDNHLASIGRQISREGIDFGLSPEEVLELTSSMYQIYKPLLKNKVVEIDLNDLDDFISNNYTEKSYDSSKH